MKKSSIIGVLILCLLFGVKLKSEMKFVYPIRKDTGH